MEENDDSGSASDLEGLAFTFCKSATLALVLRRYTLLGTAALATVFYLAAAAQGQKSWRCFVKPPWVTVFMGIVAAEEVWRLFFRDRRAPDRRAQ